MRLREEKIFHLANLIVNKIKAEGLVEYTDEARARKVIKAAILEYLKLEDEIDTRVRAKIASYSRRIPEGSGEWEVLYRKFYSEEMARARARGGR